MLKLESQYFGHLIIRADSLDKTLMLGKTEVRSRRGDRGWDGWMASPTQWTWVCVDSRSWWWTERPGVLQFMGSQIVGHDWATELNLTERCLASSFNICMMNVCTEFSKQQKTPNRTPQAPPKHSLNGRHLIFLLFQDPKYEAPE